MTDTLKPHEMITDFITGRQIPNVGTEENRQQVERYLIEQKGYEKDDIAVDVPIEIEVAGEIYRSFIDLVIGLKGKPVMAVKCAAGSFGSWSREIVSASRLLGPFQIPISVVSDGTAALVLDTITGKSVGEGMAAIPSHRNAQERILKKGNHPLPEDRLEREKLIFRSYDMMKINVKWKQPE